MSTSNDQDVVLSAVGELLRASGGDSVVALNALLKQTQKDGVVVAQKSTVASRKAAYKRMLDEFDIDGLSELEIVAAGLLGRMISNNLDSADGTLSAEQAKAAMAEHLDVQKLTEVFSVRASERKSAVFRHINTVLAAEGIEDPEHTNGSLPVPELGMRFAREGSGYGDPSIDEGRLRVLLGEELWAQVCEEVEVPAHVELNFSVEKVLNLARADVEVLEKVKVCLIPGAPKTPRLNPRPLSVEES